MEKPVVVVLASINWDFLFQRAQHISQQFARNGYRVYYRNPFQKKGVAPREVEDNLFVCTDWDLVERKKWKNVIYLIYFPAHHAWVVNARNNLIIYDCVDDFEEHDPHQEKMLAKSDLVFTTAELLFNQLHTLHPNVYLVPNGVDYEHFSHTTEIPEDMANLQHPVIGFTGSLNPRWVDVKLMEKLIVGHPEWSFVIVGMKAGLKDFPNLHYLGVKQYADLPGYVWNFDVTLIPFLDNRISRAADPVKMYEYLAAGKPVVARALPETQKISDLYLYSTEEEAENAIQNALAEGHEKKADYQSIAKTHTWEGRFKLIDEMIKQKVMEKGW